MDNVSNFVRKSWQSAANCFSRRVNIALHFRSDYEIARKPTVNEVNLWKKKKKNTILQFLTALPVIHAETELSIMESKKSRASNSMQSLQL